MAISNIYQAMNRITISREEWPIAVFIIMKKKRKRVKFCETLFANTIATRIRIKKKDGLLIGIFCASDSRWKVRDKIINNINTVENK